MTAWSLDKHGPVTVLAFKPTCRTASSIFAVLLELGDLLETCAGRSNRRRK